MAKMQTTGNGQQATGNGSTKPGRMTKAKHDELQAKAITVAALKRAASRIAGDDELPQIESGTYPVNMTFKVKGDIVVAVPRQIAGRESATASEVDLLAALLPIDSAQAERAMISAVKLVREASEGNEQSKATLAAQRELASALRDRVCKTQGLWKITPSSMAAGSTTGKPEVTAKGTVKVSEANVAVEMASA